MQRPSALSLMLCDQVIIDRDSGKPTMVGLFNSFRAREFPFIPRPFDAYADLTDGQGRVAVDLVVTNLEDEGQIVSHHLELHFPNPFHIL